MSYEVRCPSDPYENTTVWDLAKAYDLCYSLAEEYGYAMIISWAGPHQQLIAEYSF